LKDKSSASIARNVPTPKSGTVPVRKLREAKNRKLILGDGNAGTEPDKKSKVINNDGTTRQTSQIVGAHIEQEQISQMRVIWNTTRESVCAKANTSCFNDGKNDTHLICSSNGQSRNLGKEPYKPSH
jgi:hypothetical protein